MQGHVHKEKYCFYPKCVLTVTVEPLINSLTTMSINIENTDSYIWYFTEHNRSTTRETIQITRDSKQQISIGTINTLRRGLKPEETKYVQSLFGEYNGGFR